MIRVSVEQTNCRLTTEQWWRTHKAGHRRKNKMNHKTQSPTDIWTHNSTSHTRIQLAEPALANPSREKVLLHDLCRLLGLLATREKTVRSAYDGFVLLCYADGLWFWLFINHKIISSNLKQCVFRDKFRGGARTRCIYMRICLYLFNSVALPPHLLEHVRNLLFFLFLRACVLDRWWYGFE